MIYLLMALALNLGAAHSFEVAPDETMNLMISGQGEPVVFMPGLSGCAYGFRKVTPALVDQGYQAIIIEPLAIGSSSKPRGADYSLSAQAGRVAAVMDSLGISDAVVVGHGVSASISLRLALLRPDLVRVVISLEGGVQESAATPAVEKSLKLASLVAKLGGARVLRERFQSDLEAASGDRTWVTGLTVRKYFAPVSRDLSASIDVLGEMARAQDPLAIRDNLHLVRCPVLLLTGGAPHEGGLAEEDLALLATGLPRFHHRTVPGSGHFIFEENPQAVVQAVLEMAGQTTAQPPVDLALDGVGSAGSKGGL
jgi:pimeloyl-ACP methyl ester carboxylesterase